MHKSKDIHSHQLDKIQSEWVRIMPNIEVDQGSNLTNAKRVYPKNLRRAKKS